MATSVPVSEVKSNTRENRTAAHSHIKGLGLKGPDGRADVSGGGFVGQAAAREVLDRTHTAHIAFLTVA